MGTLKMLGLRLSLFCSVYLATTAGASGVPALQESIAITLPPGQSTLESFQITLPEMVKTMTEISMVTVTQMSMQTMTVMSMVTQTSISLQMATVTQMSTLTIPGTCAVMPPPAQPTSVAVVTAGALDQADSATLSVAFPTASSVIETAAAAAVASAVPMASGSSSAPCDCSCLCPMDAFPMIALANTTSTATAMPTAQMSTFQKMASASAAMDMVATPSSSMPIMTATSGTGSVASPSSLSSAVFSSAPSLTVAQTSSSTTAIAAAQVKAQDAPPPLNINTYSLMQSISLPVIVGREAKPTVR